MPSGTSAPHDLTDTLQARVAELERENLLLRAIVDGMPGMVVAKDLEGRILYANPAAACTSSSTPAELIGRTDREILPPDLAAKLATREREALAFLRPVTAEEAGEVLGQIRSAVATTLPVLDREGGAIGVAHLISDTTEQRRLDRELRIFQTLVENSPDGIVVTDLAGTIGYTNAAYHAMIGYGELTGQSIATVLSESEVARIPAVIERLLHDGVLRDTIVCRHFDGHEFVVAFAGVLLRDDRGQPTGLAAITRDLSEQQRAEQERLALQEQVIEAQQAALKELSTPLMPISEGLVVMPLVGSIDSSRAQQIMETLLTGVAELRATTAIIDITGVKVVDTQVANALVRAAQAAQLLGARVVLTGIGPEVAQTLVHLAADLRGLVTRGNLQSGIAYALASARGATQHGRKG